MLEQKFNQTYYKIDFAELDDFRIYQHQVYILIDRMNCIQVNSIVYKKKQDRQ